MKYIPKTLPLLEVRVPEPYHQRVQEVLEAYAAGNVVSAISRRAHLANAGVVNSIEALNTALGRGMSQAAKAYDILFFTLLMKEVEHDRTAVDSEDVRSGQFESELVDLIHRVRAAEDPTYLDE